MPAFIVPPSDSPTVRLSVVSLEQQLRNRTELHVAGAFINRPDLRVAIELLDRVLLRVPVADEQFHAKRRHPLRLLPRLQLRNCRVLRITYVHIYQSRCNDYTLRSLLG